MARLLADRQLIADGAEVRTHLAHADATVSASTHVIKPRMPGVGWAGTESISTGHRHELVTAAKRLVA